MSIAGAASSILSSSVASRRRELGPVPGLVGQPIEMRQHVLVGRIDAQRAPVDLEGGVLVRQAPFLDLGDPREKLDWCERILGCAPPSPRRPR